LHQQENASRARATKVMCAHAEPLGPHVSWSAALLLFLISHAAGDILMQTDWQAITKVAGLGDAGGRRALTRHIGTYMLAFVPALAWVAAETTVLRAVAVGALIAIPHLLIDDGRIVSAWLRAVKHVPNPALGLRIAVDQTFHAICLLGAALVAAA
jgi:Protein of unknown function (DUF3307)